MLCSWPPRPSLRSRNVGQDDDVSEILKTASCKTVWKAALKAWNSKHRSRRSSKALISGALDIFTLSNSFKAAEDPGKRNVCKFEFISQTTFFPIYGQTRRGDTLASWHYFSRPRLAVLRQEAALASSVLTCDLQRGKSARTAPPCTPHQPSFLTFTPSPV
jgi:hypothetical protein